MPTVMLTTKCVNSCEWCFAKAKMAEYQSRGIDEMDLADLASVMRFFESSGLRSLVLMGGEPLLHSRFLDALELLRSRDFEVHVMTTGICLESQVDQIAAGRFPALKFALNSTSYFRYPPPKRRRVDYFLRHIGHPVSLSYTITEADLDGASSLPVIDRLGLIMQFSLPGFLMFQVAAPAEGNSQYIPRHRYRELVDLLKSWLKLLRQNGVTGVVDCHSIPLCAMSGTEMDSVKLRTACDCFVVDIGPGLEAWPCFPLSGIRADLRAFGSFDEIRAHFEERVQTMGHPCPKNCVTCIDHGNRRCDGGCFGFRVRQGFTREGLSRLSAGAPELRTGA